MEKQEKIPNEIDFFRKLSPEDVQGILDEIITSEQLSYYNANVYEIIGKVRFLFASDLKSYFNIKSPNFIRINYQKNSSILLEEEIIVAEAFKRDHKAYFLLQFWLPVLSNIVLLYEGYYTKFKAIHNLDFPEQPEVLQSIMSMRCFLLIVIRHDLFPPRRIS